MKKHVHFVIDKLFRQPFWKPAEANIRTSKSRFLFVTKYFFYLGGFFLQRQLKNSD